MSADHPLTSQLQALHESLSQTKQVDAETLELLSTLTDDIQRLAQQTPLAPTDEIEPVKNRLQDMLLRFETEHPHLASAIEQVSNGLANLGI